uniref:Uncharacterized protein n=1 Tax=viral metagenome TaxID=1070528 RepID=A0A6C0JEC5_9ZZZZ
MKKKCPPGVICIENITMVFISLFIVIALYFVYCYLFKTNNTTNLSVKVSDERKHNRRNGGLIGLDFIPQFPNFPYTNLLPPRVPGDVLLNPYSPPLRDERYLIPQLNFVPPGTIPINVSTNVGAVDTSYRQVGILNPSNKPNKDNVLPLMGRPVFTNRDKWQYYTIGNQHNNIKLPIIVKGKSGLNEYGVDRLYNGDTIYIEGLNDVYRATIYDNDTIKYLPFI